MKKIFLGVVLLVSLFLLVSCSPKENQNNKEKINVSAASAPSSEKNNLGSGVEDTLYYIGLAAESYKQLKGQYPNTITDLNLKNGPITSDNFAFADYHYSCSFAPAQGYLCTANPNQCHVTGDWTYTLKTGRVITKVDCLEQTAAGATWQKTGDVTGSGSNSPKTDTTTIYMNEVGALSIISIICMSAEGYKLNHGQYPNSVADLVPAQIPEDYTKSSRSGYGFDCTFDQTSGCHCVATPNNCHVTGDNILTLVTGKVVENKVCS